MAKAEDKAVQVQDDLFGGLEALHSLDGIDIGFTGIEEIGQGDIKLGRWKLIQNTSAEVSKEVQAGMFYNTVTKETKEDLVVTVLKVGKSRVMFPEKYKKGDKALCRSIDFVNKTEGIPDAGPKCAECKYSEWADGEKSQCSIVYYFIGIDETDNPFRIQFRGASVPPIKDFLSQIFIQLQKLNKGIFSFKIKISSEYVQSDKGNYYIAIPSPAKGQDGKLIVPTAAQYTEYAETASFMSEFYSRKMKDSDTFNNEYSETDSDLNVVEASAETQAENSGVLY